MKNLMYALLVLFSFNCSFLNAQQSKTTPKKATTTKTVQKSNGVKLKKDGTPDKRYKASKKLKKDGTPDKRFKENK